MCLHGEMSQRRGIWPSHNLEVDGLLLVATNVAARGLDVEGVSHVIQWDCLIIVKRLSIGAAELDEPGMKGATCLSFLQKKQPASRAW